jgi:signal transduction histidine kinase
MVMKNYPRLNETGINPNLSRQLRSSQKGKKALNTLPAELAKYRQLRQMDIAAITLEAQERERVLIGMELHDNINQILASTKLLLSAVEANASRDKDLIDTCIKNLQKAIDENRKIAHDMVAPDFVEQTLTESIECIVKTMLQPAGVGVHLESIGLKEQLLLPQQKLAIYRILQEQCTNITKHAAAKNVRIELCTSGNKFNMKIADDGKGMRLSKKANGIGLENIKNRLTVLHGRSIIHSKPGKGFSLEVELPLTG